jgi:chlorite dismutase
MSEHPKAQTPISAGHPELKAAGLAAVDVHEYGGKKDGERQALDRRLFMQLLVFEASTDPAGHARRLAEKLLEHRVSAVVYADVNAPSSLGLLTWSDDPTHFVTRVRHVLGDEAFRSLRQRPKFTMLGRTYATGHEPQLAWSLLERSIENVLNEALDWAVWYPLRRTGAFARLEPQEQGAMLREHAQLGMAYGQADLAHDVRLACHGLDPNDNDFVIGLLGRGLHPLSHCVQSMRKTVQTSQYIEKMGPFFVGHVAHRVVPPAG